jgi:hypothetical protein
MKNVFTTLCMLLSMWSMAQSVYVIDFVKIKENRKAETYYYYENNWKLYRMSAREKGFIKSYNILTTTPDSAANYDLMLITEYADSMQYKRSEENFQPIIKQLRPNGPVLLNEVKPADFRQAMVSKKAYSLWGTKINE